MTRGGRAAGAIRSTSQGDGQPRTSADRRELSNLHHACRRTQSRNGRQPGARALRATRPGPSGDGDDRQHSRTQTRGVEFVVRSGQRRMGAQVAQARHEHDPGEHDQPPAATKHPVDGQERRHRRRIPRPPLGSEGVAAGP
jgi:hypothetical protein